jgi:hypothetical protein
MERNDRSVFSVLFVFSVLCWPSRKPSSVPATRAARMVICLGWPSPATSSSLPAASLAGWSVRVAPRRLFGLAPTGGYRATAVTSGAVGSYPTFSPLPTLALRPLWAVSFLWPCPSPLGAQALPGSLPYGARTFLGRLAAPATIALDQRGGIYRAYRLSAIGYRMFVSGIMLEVQSPASRASGRAMVGRGTGTCPTPADSR